MKLNGAEICESLCLGYEKCFVSKGYYIYSNLFTFSGIKLKKTLPGFGVTQFTSVSAYSLKERCTRSMEKPHIPASDETIRGTQREYSSKPHKHSIVERILVFKR